MSIDHGRLNVLVAKQLQNRPDVATAFKELDGKRMPERPARGPLRQPRLHNRTSNVPARRLYWRERNASRIWPNSAGGRE